MERHLTSMDGMKTDGAVCQFFSKEIYFISHMQEVKHAASYSVRVHRYRISFPYLNHSASFFEK